MGSEADEFKARKQQWVKARKKLHQANVEPDQQATVYFGDWRTTQDVALGRCGTGSPGDVVMLCSACVLCRRYYFNEVTKEVRWDPPTIPAGAAGEVGEGETQRSAGVSFPDEDTTQKKVKSPPAVARVLSDDSNVPSYARVTESWSRRSSGQLAPQAGTHRRTKSHTRSRSRGKSIGDEDQTKHRRKQSSGIVTGPPGAWRP